MIYAASGETKSFETVQLVQVRQNAGYCH